MRVKLLLGCFSSGIDCELEKIIIPTVLEGLHRKYCTHCRDTQLKSDMDKLDQEDHQVYWWLGDMTCMERELGVEGEEAKWSDIYLPLPKVESKRKETKPVSEAQGEIE